MKKKSLLTTLLITTVVISNFIGCGNAATTSTTPSKSVTETTAAVVKEETTVATAATTKATEPETTTAAKPQFGTITDEKLGVTYPSGAIDNPILKQISDLGFDTSKYSTSYFGYYDENNICSFMVLNYDGDASVILHENGDKSNDNISEEEFIKVVTDRASAYYRAVKAGTVPALDINGDGWLDNDEAIIASFFFNSDETFQVAMVQQNSQGGAPKKLLQLN